MTKSVYCELAQFGLIRFTGSEAQTFLHNQLTCDVAALTAGSSTYGSYCTPKGRVLATFLLWRSGEDFFMQLASMLREPIQKHVTKFILRAKVKATDATPEWTLFGIAGKDAAALARSTASAVPTALHQVAQGPG
ncbi:MAG: YgfZ/GcvT domain-containing protein, partial [Longimicrobiales bacterium]